MRTNVSILKRGAIGATAIALGALAFGPSTALASQAKGATINTFGSWDGSSMIQPFGCPETSNYGETITIPKKKHHINKATFAWTDLTTGSMVVTAYVYQWDAATHMPTGPQLGTSKSKTVSSGHSGFYNESFKLKTKKLKPGQQYVVFASIDVNYEQCTDNYTTGWGAIPDDTVYPGGTLVFLNSDGDEGQWETVPWTDTFGYDLAMKMYMSK
jgi:hypothetical protein